MRPAARALAASALLASTVATIGLALGAAVPPHATLARRSPPARATAAGSIRLVAVSGDRQSARAFAASTGPGYETPYPQPLVVRVVGSRARGGATPLVLRFACVSRDCRFAASDQGDDVTRVSPQSYDVRVLQGRATLPPTLSTDRVPGVFVVRVTVSPRAHVRATSDVVFHLVVR